MQKTFNCTVHCSNFEVFEVEYKSICEKENDPMPLINVITKVEVNGHELFLSSLRGKLIYKEIEAAVKNNSANMWSEYWKDKSKLQSEIKKPVEIVLDEENKSTLHY